MDPLVLGLAALSAACFLAFALRPRSSPRDQIEGVRPADDNSSTPAFGKATHLRPIWSPPPFWTTRPRRRTRDYWCG